MTTSTQEKETEGKRNALLDARMKKLRVATHVIGKLQKLHQLSQEKLIEVISKKRSSIFVRMESDYNEHSASQASAADILCQWLTKYTSQALEESVGEGEPFRVAEYGCATGGSSISPLKSILAGIDKWNDTEEEKSNHELIVTLNDMPLNNWEELEATVEPVFPDVTFDYAKRSMYADCVAPPKSVHVAYSCLAQHWLNDGSPSTLPEGCLWGNQLPLNHPDRKVWEESSRYDWSRFLELRAQEIAPGGYIIIVIQASRADGQLEECVAETLKVAKAKMLEKGIFTTEAAAAMVMPEYAKSPTEVFGPLQESTDWTVQEFHYWPMTCPLKASFEAGEKSKEDAIAGQLGIMRAFMSPSLLEALNGDETKLDAYWKCVAELSKGNIDALKTNFFAMFLTLKKT